MGKYFVFLLLILSSYVKAADGCLLSDGYIHAANGFGGYFVTNFRISYCTSSDNTSTPFRRIDQSFSSTCFVGIVSGNRVDYTETFCPLDDYVWILFISVGVLGCNWLRKRTCIYSR